MNFRGFFVKHRIGIVIFALAVLVRLAVFFAYLHYHNGDFIATIKGADGYFEISENLIRGNGYSDLSEPPFIPNSIRPPAWILTMALIAKIFGSYIPVFAFQLVMSGLVPIIGMYLATRIMSDRHVPIVGFMLAFEPAAIFSTTMVVSETSFTFLFLLFFVFLIKYLEKETARNIVWAGVFLGLATLVKPTVQFLPVLIPASLLLIYRKKLSFNLFKHLAYFVAVCVLIVAPWIYRNQREFHTFGLTSQPAYNLYTVLVPTVLSIENGTSYEFEHRVIGETVSEKDGITIANSKYYTDKALRILSQHKTAFLKSIGISIVTFFTHDHMLSVLGYGGVTVPNILEKPALVLLLTDPLELFRDIILYATSPGIIVLFARLVWVAIAILFFSGASLYLRREKFSPAALMALIMVAYFAIVTTANGFGMNGRFRIPVNTFIFTFAVYGFFAFRERLQKFSLLHA